MSKAGRFLAIQCLRLRPSYQNGMRITQQYKVHSIPMGYARPYCTSNIPYENEATPVEYKNGFPTVNIMLPSRDERCVFTLRPLTDTVGSFIRMVSEEDHGIDNVAVYRKNGTKIAKATTIDILLREDFDLLINSRKFEVKPPTVEIPHGEAESVEQVKDLISQLYTQMNLTEWHASREKELTQSIETLKHELGPYEKLRVDMMDSAEKRTRRLTWAGLTMMGFQFGFLARLTWWEYSWDIMEPVTYFVTYGTSMAMFAYYVMTKQDYTFPDVRDRAFLLHVHKMARKNNYDVDHYNTLMEKLGRAEEDLEKMRHPIGLTLSETELQSLLSAKQPTAN